MRAVFLGGMMKFLRQGVKAVWVTMHNSFSGMGSECTPGSKKV
jgi:hypothetical protein